MSHFPAPSGSMTEFAAPGKEGPAGPPRFMPGPPRATPGSPSARVAPHPTWIPLESPGMAPGCAECQPRGTRGVPKSSQFSGFPGAPQHCHVSTPPSPSTTSTSHQHPSPAAVSQPSLSIHGAGDCPSCLCSGPFSVPSPHNYWDAGKVSSGIPEGIPSDATLQ